MYTVQYDPISFLIVKEKKKSATLTSLRHQAAATPITEVFIYKLLFREHCAITTIKIRQTIHDWLQLTWNLSFCFMYICKSTHQIHLRRHRLIILQIAIHNKKLPYEELTYIIIFTRRDPHSLMKICYMSDIMIYIICFDVFNHFTK